MRDRHEIEDGMGFAGLVPTAAERAEEREIEKLRHTLLQVQGERDAAYNNGFLKAEGMLSTLGPEAVWKEAERIRALGEKPP